MKQQYMKAKPLHPLIIKKKEREATVKHTVATLTAVFACAMHLEYGFGTERINRVIDAACKHFELINDGTVSMDEVFKFCIENKIKID